MRLAVVNKCFDEEFRNEANVRVNDIETSLEDKIKKLTETKHYDELNIDKETIYIEGPIAYNNSWKYCNLVCLDFAFTEATNISNDNYWGNEDVKGIYRTWKHNLVLEETHVFDTYDPTIGMINLGIYAVFHKNGLLDIVPRYHLAACYSTYTCVGYSNRIAVNCLLIL